MLPALNNKANNKQHSKMSSEYLTQLIQQIDSISKLRTKLLLITTDNRRDALALLHQLGDAYNIAPINVGLLLAQRLAVLPRNERSTSLGGLLDEMTLPEKSGEVPRLLYNLEVLFEPSLQIDPLAQLRQLARSQTVVALWPGTLLNEHFIYAESDHAEYRIDRCAGVCVFDGDAEASAQSNF